MKILFLLDLIYSDESTSIKIAKKIAVGLQKKGHSIFALCNARQDQHDILQGIKTTFFESYADKSCYEIVNKARKNNLSGLKTFINFVLNPKAAVNAFSTLVFKKSCIEGVFKKQIEALCNQTRFDVVISVSCPFYSAFALAQSKINAKKICYMLDPYHSNKSMSYAVSLKREEKLYQKVDSCIITDLMYAENQKNILAKYSDKMQVVDFPCIEDNKTICLDKPVDDYFYKGKINCAYIGNLYQGIRSPQYIFDIMPKLNEDIVFLFVGGGYQGFGVGFFESYKQKLGERLIINDAVNQEKANAIRKKADILINIGNTAENQLPSKIFEYINTGKPIINFYKIDNCPSLKYFKKYPLALNIKEGDFSLQAVSSINEFCKNNKGKSLDIDSVTALFCENTTVYVVNKFESIINQVIGE